MSMAQSLEKALNAIAGEIAPLGRAIKDLRRLSGGASQETWRFQVISEDHTVSERVLRRTAGDTARSAEALPLIVEAKLMQLARAAGVPGPKVICTSTTGSALGEGFIMNYVAGETIPQRILRGDAFSVARSLFARQAGAALGRIHSIVPSDLPRELPKSDGADQLKRYADIYHDLGIVRPVFDLAITHLGNRAPQPLPLCLVHGDFRMGNFIIDETGITAVLDWELAHIGDPREDLGWICVNSWRFGRPTHPVGGVGDLNDFLAGYAETSGHRLTVGDIHWWQMLGSLKWGIMCMIMYDTWRAGGDRSVERAAIGRRVSETEIDLIDLLEQDRTHA